MNVLSDLFVGNSQNVLFVIVTSEVVGGHELQLVNLLRGCKSFFADIRILCSSQSVYNLMLSEHLDASVVNFSLFGRVWCQYLAGVKVASKLGKFVGSNSVVLVSGGTLEACVSASRAAKILKANRVLAYVPMWIDRSVSHGYIGSIYNFFIKYFLLNVDVFITINRIQAYLISHHINKKCFVYRNTVRRVAVPNYSRGKRLVYIGRFDEAQKCLVDLIRKIDSPLNPYKVLCLVGDGPDRLVVERAASVSKFVRVELYSWMSADELDSFLGAEDCLVMNSRWEGEPLVVRECKLRGIPCVVPDIPGFRGIVRRAYRFRSVEELHLVLNFVYYSCPI